MPPIIRRPAKKKLSRSTQKGGPQQDLLVHPRAPAHHQAHALMLAPSATLGGAPELIDAQISEAIQHGVFFIACYSKELNERPETYMNGELRLAIDRLRNIPKNRVWFIPVLLNRTEIPPHDISDHETLHDINAIALYADWDAGLKNILWAMKLDDPNYRRAQHLI